jgi:site-specific DNA-methyltransferase (cytosine-N4-specific)
VVLDIFAVSNTTGAVAEGLGRKWIAFELDRTYLAASAFRFLDANSGNAAKKLYECLTEDQGKGTLVPSELQPQLPLSIV